MSEPRSGVGRRLGVLISALAFGAYLVLLAVPAQAATEGNVDCVFTAVTNRVDVTFTGSGDASLVVGAGGAIFFDDDDDASDGSPCDTATVTTTDNIFIDATGSHPSRITLDLRGGAFAPGETPEISGTPEIEFSLDGGNATEVVTIRGSDGDDNIVVGAGQAADGNFDTGFAVNWDGDDDADVTVADLEAAVNGGSWRFFGDGGNDTISLNGGSGTGGNAENFNATLVAGGTDTDDSGDNTDDGNDTLTGSNFDNGGGDRLEGDEGNDILNGLGGGDFLSDDGDLDTDTTCATDETDQLFGGNDSDELQGGDGEDLLNGGLGDDDESGGDCSDRFDQGNGPNGQDGLHGNGDERDNFECGPNRGDLVDYSQRNSDLFVNIFVGGNNDGETGEGDDVGGGIEAVVGGTANDELIGIGDDNFLAGGPGNDTLDGRNGADCIQPGAGDDTAEGGADDHDMVDYSDAPGPGGVTVDLDAETATGHGTDAVTGFVDINGSNFNDTLSGDELENDIFGNDGDDSIDGEDDDDLGDGGEGTDTVVDTGDTLEEEDTLLGGLGNDSVNGGIDDDELDGDNDEDDLTGQGNDTIEGGEGNDNLDGEGGDDTLTDSGLCDVVDDDDDDFRGGDGSDTMSSDQGEDDFNGDSGFNGTTGDGNDTVNSGAGDDDGHLDGGDDTATDTGADDGTLTSEDDECDLNPTADSDDHFEGEEGNDTLTAGAGDDHFDGNEGDDDLFGEDGDDELHGGEDDDLAEGGNGDDIIAGDDDTDVLRGDAGEDEIDGGDGADKVEGGLDDDELDGDGDGPSAPDTVLYNHLVDANGDGRGQDVDLQLGFSEGDDGNDIVMNFEKAKGSKFDDTIKGGGGAIATNFFLMGGKGDDILTGSGSNDTLKGAGGNDLLIGLQGGDTLKGGKGNDEGQGGPGADICFKVEQRVSCQAA